MSDNKNLLTEIAKRWKLDAKLEDTDRYFYSQNEVDDILSGEKCYVIGRKGTGKTAISEYLLKKANFKFSEKLSFKNFPFNELYSLSNTKYTAPNQYISIWKYLIYSFICRMMICNEGISSSLRAELAKAYGTDPITSLPRTVNTWTKKDFSLSLAGVINAKFTNEAPELEKLSWIERVNILEDIIMGHLDKSSYYIIFDELDEDYRDVTNKGEFEYYSNLITSLFKAVQDIKSIFRNTDFNIYPVVFLRDDIYSLIKDSDKNNWSDFKVDLNWNEIKIKQMLAYRISRAHNLDGEILPFDKAWNLLFFRKDVPKGNQGKKMVNSFEFISGSTHLRPRDFIRYIQVCAEDTLTQGYKQIHPKTIKFVDKAFSNYLRDEIVDEIHALLPDINNILQIISQIRKQTFTVTEFKEVYRSYLDAGTIKEKNIEYVLQTLYDFSVLGNQPKQKNNQIFRYLNREARINFREQLVVHRGLFKSLQIL